MDKVTMYNILARLINKHEILNAQHLNKILGTKKGKSIIAGKIDKIHDHEYIQFISKFIYIGFNK